MEYNKKETGRYYGKTQ